MIVSQFYGLWYLNSCSIYSVVRTRNKWAAISKWVAVSKWEAVSKWVAVSKWETVSKWAAVSKWEAVFKCATASMLNIYQASSLMNRRMNSAFQLMITTLCAHATRFQFSTYFWHRIETAICFMEKMTAFGKFSLQAKVFCMTHFQLMSTPFVSLVVNLVLLSAQ